jgi:hypothetical protein
MWHILARKGYFHGERPQKARKVEPGRLIQPGKPHETRERPQNGSRTVHSTVKAGKRAVEAIEDAILSCIQPNPAQNR